MFSEFIPSGRHNARDKVSKTLPLLWKTLIILGNVLTQLKLHRVHSRRILKSLKEAREEFLEKVWKESASHRAISGACSLCRSHEVQG